MRMLRFFLGLTTSGLDNVHVYDKLDLSTSKGHPTESEQVWTEGQTVKAEMLRSCERFDDRVVR